MKLDKVQFIKELSRERLGPVSHSKTIQPKTSKKPKYPENIVIEQLQWTNCTHCDGSGVYEDNECYIYMRCDECCGTGLMEDKE